MINHSLNDAFMFMLNKKQSAIQFLKSFQAKDFFYIIFRSIFYANYKYFIP